MPEKKTTKKEAEETRTLEVTQTDKSIFRVTVPASYKVTFGKFQPSSDNGKGYGYDNSTGTLRLYEAQDKQRACFRNVESFRDLSLPISKLVVSKDGSSQWSDDGEGNTSSSQKVRRKEKWS